ncbi:MULTISPECIES: ribosomal protein L7/L12 [unclassified Actinomyces]|uniref:ribosomal protein L7/L12 n=1 Tax=unclassified Actinomyces TaxID=2609248 RepID=UPI0020173851|nr:MULTISPECIES: ribosomal protein L7/L12 [unclassified Actinomyces]MCL3776567.1 hypothetical protein [Actinomyces sp. AC-20-1]MCL3788853.1 hypothetical protein [Actinomyces sp. 187325]MCL3791041.1 hypothetical protein [Actinomyces sp. 186855]MCL3793433.1 hypothetical protein [Actinomyces sp. 217892]
MNDADGSSLFSWLFGRRKEERPSRQAHTPRVPVDPPSEPASAAESALVAGGQTLAAIKAYRDRTGADLASAKRAIDAARALGAQAAGHPGGQLTPPSAPADKTGLTPEETALATVNPVLAIKMVRERTGLGLKAAKALVDTAR